MSSDKEKRFWTMIIVLAGIVVLLVVWIARPSGYEQLQQRYHQITGEKNILQQEHAKTLREQAKLINDTTALSEEVKRMAGLNHRQSDALNRMIEREKHYEKQLKKILLYSDAVMDSLYRSAYPRPDSILR